MSDQDEARDQDVAVKQDNQPAQRPNEENYEDEEEEDGNGDKPPIAGQKCEVIEKKDSQSLPAVWIGFPTQYS